MRVCACVCVCVRVCVCVCVCVVRVVCDQYLGVEEVLLAELVGGAAVFVSADGPEDDQQIAGRVRPDVVHGDDGRAPLRSLLPLLLLHLKLRLRLLLCTDHEEEA